MEHVNDERFVGTWTLKSVTRVTPAGIVNKPFADAPLGYITYGKDGFMHAILMKSSRKPIGIPPEELSDAVNKRKVLTSWKYIRAGLRYLRAMSSFLSYCGTYETRGNIVVHHVKAAMVPDWIGTDLERDFVFSGDTLTLSANDASGNVMTLVWERVV